MTTTMPRYIDPMLSWRRMLLAMDPIEARTAEDIAAGSGVPIRTVKPYLCQFRSAELVEQDGEQAHLWTRICPAELVKASVSLRELVDQHRLAIQQGTEALDDARLSNNGIENMAFFSGGAAHG